MNAPQNDSPAVWQTLYGDWYYAHPRTGAHYGPFSTLAEAAGERSLEAAALAEERAGLTDEQAKAMLELGKDEP